MRQRFTFGVIMVMALALLGGATAHAEVRLAYVDIQRALNDCDAGKKAKAQFRVRVERLQGQLERQQQEVQTLKNELQQKGALMQPDQRQNLVDKYNSKLRDFQDNYKNSRDELRQSDNEMTGSIVRDLATVVRQVARKDGYTMVLEKGSLLWATPSIDITDEVIRTYDAMHVKPGSLGAEAAASSYQTSRDGGRFSNGGTMSRPSIPESGRSTITK
ncbi:MAG: OmpH family outer membrane protein [Candidatus Binataceae bacterium]